MAPRPTVLTLAWPGLLALCPGLRGQAKVFLTRDQALERAFPAARAFLERSHVLDKRERKSLEKRVGRKLPERGFLTYLALDRAGKPIGFAVVTAELGKFERFLLLVATSLDGTVTDIELLEYREPRGAEIRRPSYLKRYRGISLRNVKRKLRRVPILPGATLSCHGVTRAVAKVLCLHAMYGDLLATFKRAKARRVEVRPRKKQAGLMNRGVPAMGDVARVELAVPAAAADVAACLAVVARLERDLSPRIADSLTKRANALDLGATLDLGAWPHLVAPLEAAFNAAAESGGRFSPVPARADPFEAFVFEQDCTRLRRVGSGELDPGAFAKGLAADRLADELDLRGLDWTVAGFRSSFVWRRGERRVGIAVSGSACRGAHIVDPRSGRRLCADREFRAVAPSAFAAEVLSTESYVRGSEA